MEKFIDSLMFEKNSDLLVEAETKWFEHKFKSEPTEFEPIKNLEHINKLRDYARKIYEQDIVNYNQYRDTTRRSDHNWIKTVLKTGTISDKISANCILLQDSAVHNLSSLDNLISSVKLNKKRECMLSIDAIKDLFMNNLMPKCALKSFNEHPFEFLAKFPTTQKSLRDKRLLLWYFESILKMKYFNFIKELQLIFQDTIANTKFKVASTLFDLVSVNPYEQQRFIFEMLINKLGDPDYQVASRIVYLVKNYLVKCPKMKKDLLVEIERLVSRQNLNQRAQYYGFCCMNQFVLKKQDNEVANRLLLIYFSFFKKFIKHKEIDSRMLNALLTGVNRAYKYAKMDHDEIDKNLNTLFKLVHVTSFNVSIQALMLLNQVMDSRDDMIHRYYNALYKRMFDLEWRNTAKQTYFLNLLYNSVIKDEAILRIKAFVKRLLQICFSQNAPFVCGSIMLISEIIKSKKSVFQLDHSVLSKNKLLGNENSFDSKFAEDDEEEKFVDVKSESEEEKDDVSEKDENEEEDDDERTNGSKNCTNKKDASWIHKKNIVFKRHDRYDYQERNPLYCGADKTLTYELLPLTRHYHPTVVVFANKLMNEEPVDYTGDPMEDFTLVHFLDRFVYKNPKKSKSKDQPIKKSVFEPVKSLHRSTIKNIPINSKEYLNLDYKQIPEEEKLFYNYYKSQEKKKGELEDVESDAESVSDTEFDAYLSKNEVDGADGNDDWALDFADGVSKKRKKSKKAKEEEEEMEDDDDDDDAGDAIMDEFENDEDFENELNEEMEGDEDFDDDIITMKKHKKRGKEDLSKLFAAADEFSDIINESAKYDKMGVGSISNNDKSDPKQLKWEMNRDEKMNGEHWKKNKGKAFSKKNGFHSKKKNFGNGNFKNKNKVSHKMKKKH